MKFKKTLTATLVVVCGIASISTFAAKAQTGYRIFNQSAGTYITHHPKACTGVTFPTPIRGKDNGKLMITSAFRPGSVCSTQYRPSNPKSLYKKGGSCLVGITCNPADGVITVYATPMGVSCSAIDGNTAIVLK